MRSRQSQRIHRRLETLHAHPHFGEALNIIRNLQKQGFQAVLAGGCVRDGLLGQVPKDLDIATSAPPETNEASFANTLAVGKAFGTIVVIEDGQNFELTTFRRETAYSDGRHPDGVEFTNMEEDAKRRDFTVNALFYDPLHEEIFDFVQGTKDLDDKLLRTVGSATERFSEDYLRMLRAPRFVAQLGFQLDQEALHAIQELHASIAKVSIERIFNEMRRLLSSSYVASGLRVLQESHLEREVWSELALADLDRFAPFGPFSNWETAFAAVMLLASESSGEIVLRAWKAPRDAIRRVQELMDGCRALMNPQITRAARLRILGGEEYAGILQLAAGLLPGNAEIVQGWIEEFLTIAGANGKLPLPFLNGQDLILLGVEPGAGMGELLKTLYEAQLAGNLLSREAALKEVLRLVPAARAKT